MDFWLKKSWNIKRSGGQQREREMEDRIDVTEKNG
jgi:hypothetical protein